MANGKKKKGTGKKLEGVSHGDVSVMDQLFHMTEGSYEESGLDPESFMLVRLAALTAMDAAPASWMMNLKIGKELGLTQEQALGVLVAIAPIVGSARVVSAAGSILRALGMEAALEESVSQAVAA